MSQRNTLKEVINMEELKIIKITKDNSTGNKKLDTCINKINTEFSRGIKASHEIARQLQKIRDEELYTTTGAESFSEFSEKWFNISRSQASRLASISEKFLHEKMIDADTGKEIYTYEEYTTSKLVEMLKATDEQLAMITSDMTVKEIRDFISGKAIEDSDESDNGNDDSDESDSDGSEKKSNKNKFDVEALKAKINEAIDALSYGEIAEKSAYENVLDWIEELI